jgi:hypothetical protein
VTITYPLCLALPDGVSAGTDKGTVFTVLMTMSTLLNFMLIVISMAMYTQFCCCVNEETKVNFTAKFGWRTLCNFCREPHPTDVACSLPPPPPPLHSL